MALGRRLARWTAGILVALAFEIGGLLQADTQPQFLPNSCLVFANEFENALLARQIMNHVQWTRIVAVTKIYWFRKPAGHALCVFALRSGDVWVYDTNDGSRPLGTRSHDLKDIADRLHAIDSHNHFARWLD